MRLVVVDRTTSDINHERMDTLLKISLANMKQDDSCDGG